MSSNRALTLVFPAFGAALIAVLSQISIPIGTVPFTLQTLAVGLVASTFRFRDASLSILVYWLLGAIGLPVFAGGAVGRGLPDFGVRVLRQVLQLCGKLLRRAGGRGHAAVFVLPVQALCRRGRGGRRQAGLCGRHFRRGAGAYLLPLQPGAAAAGPHLHRGDAPGGAAGQHGGAAVFAGVSGVLSQVQPAAHPQGRHRAPCGPAQRQAL